MPAVSSSKLRGRSDLRQDMPARSRKPILVHQSLTIPEPKKDGGNDSDSDSGPGPGPGPEEQGKSNAPTNTSPPSDYTYAAWDKFLCEVPSRISAATQKIVHAKESIEQTPGEGLQSEGKNAFHSWAQAAEECRAKVADIVVECQRLNQKYRDPNFDLELNPFCVRSLDDKYPKGLPPDSSDTPVFVKRIEDVFDKPQFFVDGASASDVHQGASGDCWFLAALMAVSAKRELIENRLCVARDTKVDVYGFVFYRDGEWIYEIVDGLVFVNVGDVEPLTLIKNFDPEEKTGSYVGFNRDKYEELRAQLQRGGEALYFSHCKSNETWLPLIEKAYAKAHGDYYSIEGGFTSEGVEDLTGGVGVILASADIMDKDRFWKEQLSQVNQKYLFGGSTSATIKGLVGSHAYAVLQAWEKGDLRLLKIRNPWGDCEWEGDWADGSKQWTSSMMEKLQHTFGDDGVFWISYADFLKHFETINRVRLLSTEEWRVSQCWTCVNVPWAVDFLDTKFVFTIEEKCSVVVVLCQPDDRYFWALRGRYFYALHFRIYKEGDDSGRWIVRSMHSSGAEPEFTRSVSAEIEDLEPGTYHVIFKVIAQRQKEAKTASQAIMEYARARKEKLLAIGRKFDYAQSKGNLRAMEEANKKQKKQDGREFVKAQAKRERKLSKLQLERSRARKRRVRDALRQKRRAAEEERRANVETPADAATAGEAPVGSEAADEKRESKTILTPPETEASSQEGGEAKVTEGTSNAEGAGSEEATAGAKDDGAAKGESTTQASENPTDTQSTEPKAAGGRGDYRPARDEQENLVDGFRGLAVQDAANDQRPPSRAPSPGARSDVSDASPAEEQMYDEDFDWNSDIDGSAYLSSGEDDDAFLRRYELSANNEIFDGDPWNAMCVLGLRVYAQNATAKVTVVKGENSS